MADDKDPREEALWEYANEKVRHETRPARRQSPQAAWRAVLPLFPLAHPPPFRPRLRYRAPLRCTTAQGMLQLCSNELLVCITWLSRHRPTVEAEKYRTVHRPANQADGGSHG